MCNRMKTVFPRMSPSSPFCKHKCERFIFLYVMFKYTPKSVLKAVVRLNSDVDYIVKMLVVWNTRLSWKVVYIQRVLYICSLIISPSCEKVFFNLYRQTISFLLCNIEVSWTKHSEDINHLVSSCTPRYIAL